MEDKKLIIPALVSANGDDVTTWALPEGAIARLGRGSGDIGIFTGWTVLRSRYSDWTLVIRTPHVIPDCPLEYGTRNDR